MDGVTFWLLWTFIFCVPWEEQVPLPGGVAMSHFVGMAAGAAGVLSCLLKKTMRKLSLLHYVLAALVVWSALTYNWSIAPELTAVKAWSSVQLALMVWLIWEFAPSDERLLSLFAAYVLGTYVSALSTIHSAVTGTGDNLGVSEGRFTAPGFNENELGIILALGVVMSCYLLAKGKRPRAVWLLNVPVCVVAICLTGSRGSIISAAVALFAAPVAFGMFTGAHKKSSILALILVGVSAVAFLPAATWTRIASIQGELAEGTLTKRTYIWAAGLDVFREHPMLGVGAGAFGPSVYQKLDIPYVAHNTYLSILVELGVPGALLFAGLLAGLLYEAGGLPTRESRVWILLLITWAIAILSVTWEHRKPTWFLFGMLMAHSGVVRSAAACQAGLVRGNGRV
jgi:O-antigen ligase